MIIKIAMAVALSAVTAWMPALGQYGSVGEAIRAYEDRDYNKAFNLLKNEEIVNPTNGVVQIYLAKIDVAYGDRASAVDKYLNALKLLPKNDYENRILAVRSLVSILSKFEGGGKKALEIVEKEMKIFGKTDMLLFCKAVCDRYDAKNLDDWRSVAASHISDDIDFYAYESIAKILRDRGDLQGAIDAYSAALKLSPYDDKLLQDRASAYWQVGDTAAAVGDACLNLLANRTEIDHSVLLTCYDACRSALEKLRDGRYGSVVDFAEFVNAMRACRYADAYETSRGESFRRLNSHSSVLSCIGLYGKAEESMLADSETLTSPSSLGLLATNYLRMGDFPAAKRYLDMALGMKPTDVDLYRSQAELCILSDDADGAMAYADTILALCPHSSMPEPLRACYINYERGKAKALAQSYLEYADSVGTQFPSSYVSGSEIYYYAMAGDTLNFARGVEAARKYGDSDDWFNIALAYASTGHEEEAIDAISTAFERGFCHFIYVEKAPEFEWLKYSDRFNTMMARAQEEQTRRIERLLNE